MSETDRDPFAPIEASPRFGATLVVIAFVAAAASLVGGAAPIAGPIGMACGLVAHVKGHRLGMPSAVVAGLAMIVGFTILLYLR